MAFTLLGFEAFSKYVAGPQTFSLPLNMKSSGQWEEVYDSIWASYDTSGSKTFAGESFLEPDGGGVNFGIWWPFTETGHCYIAMNLKAPTTGGALSEESIRIQSGSTNVVSIGRTSASALSTRIWKNGTFAKDSTSAEGAVRTVFTAVEIYYYQHGTSGVIKVWIDRNLVYEFTGDTDFSSGVGVNRIVINARGSNYTYETRDFYVGTVTAESDCPRKPFIVKQLPPDSDSLTTNWTTGGANHYGQLDDETVSDSATTTISATTTTAKCKFGIDDQYLPANSTPFAVKVLPVAIRSAAAPSVCDLRPIVDSNGTESAGGWVALSDSMWKHGAPTYWATDPNTAAAWTSSGIANLLVGMELREQP